VEDQAPILELIEIGKAFSGISVLRNVNLTVFPGEVHCIVGENGAGKSTLIKIISGAYKRDTGTIKYLGQTLEDINPHWSREHGINTIYQEVDLIPSLDAAENIYLGNEPLTPAGNIDWNVSRRKAEALLHEIGAEINMREPVGKLKIAYQQMVAIAKSLSVENRLMIFDEPTAVFTGSEVEALFKLIDKLKKSGIGILYITHHLDEIFEIGDRVTVLRDGNHVRTDRVSEIDKNVLVKAMVGRDIDFSQRNGHCKPGDEIFRVSGLTNPGIFEDISFTLHCGEIVGVAGLVGAGRTEMARAIIGALPYTRGEITVRGKPVKIASPQKALEMGIGMLPESRKEEGLVGVRTIGENISYSMVESNARLGIVPWKKVTERVLDLVERLNVKPPRPNLQVGLLSGGNQQKVVLGKLLAAQNDLLILDEPTRGVDVGARSEIYNLIQLLKQEGKAILMISSDMIEILTQSDRILVMAGGRIVGELPGKQATEEQVLKLALQLEEEVAE
jgi:ribose transport system ATP-binding protein